MHAEAGKRGHEDCLIVMAKEPRAGHVKTRLAASVGPARAADLYAAFLHDTLLTCRRVTGAELCFSIHSAAGSEYFRALDAGARLHVQPDGDFGARLRDAFDSAFALGFERVVVIGSDTPHLRAEMIEQAFERVRPGEPVVGPTRDGGYYLLAMCEANPELFRSVEWSSARVLSQTEERARSAGLRIHRLEENFDVDEASDLACLFELLDADDGGLCPVTKKTLLP
jgi:hypothetical protein